jgi:hypothetical protein
MNCMEINKLLIAYLDCEVTAKESEFVQSHINTCSNCRDKMGSLSLTMAKCRQTLYLSSEIEDPSPKVLANLKQQIENGMRTPVKGGDGSMSNLFGDLRGLFSRKSPRRPIAFGAIALILVFTLTLALPPLFSKHNRVLASDIALDNPEVRAALNGIVPANIGVTDNIDSAGRTRVVMTMPPDRVLVADVDMKKQEVTSVNVKSAADVTLQQIIDIAQADPRVQELLKGGYHIYYSGAARANVSIFDEKKMAASLREVGLTNPQDFYGFISAIMLKVNPDDIWDFYGVFVNESIGKVVGIVGNPFPTGIPPMSVTVKPTSTWELYQ